MLLTHQSLPGMLTHLACRNAGLVAYQPQINNYVVSAPILLPPAPQLCKSVDCI